MRYRRRAPFRRRRRVGIRRGLVFRRSFHRRRRSQWSKTPSMYCKLTRTIQYTHTNSALGLQSMQVRPSDFSEFTNQASNWERVKIYKLRVRVYPQQNVANNTTSRIPNYAMVPYHRPTDTLTTTFPACLSIDRAKVYRGTSFGQMNYVPLARIGVQTAGSGSVFKLIREDWKPLVQIGSDATDVNLYTGFIAFEGVEGLTGSSYYTIVQDLYVKFIQQRGFI
ncbi:putative capsid protein [Cyclovirus roach]|uniref:Capsid protein n=1 Tax=Cyclovirus roach TaxID=3052164 RepID=L7WMP5_9CIRC|nr:putative capsid protein [Cyclovirus roach]AGC84156.1 putative capsid protein [Cyclovirus roach]